ncbi:hypothetical protein ACHAXR_004759 [Thalassiosira sp. AJA248-18]
MQGLRDLGIDVEYIRGSNVTDNPDKDDFSGITLCQQMRAGSDATILVMGLNQTIESEDIDRTSLLLPRVQCRAIEGASHCSKAKSPNAPVILVVITGGTLDLSLYKDNDNIDAILYTSYPGQSGGTALAQVLFGNYNPSGRLVTTMYHNSYLDQVALEDMRMRTVGSTKFEEQEEDWYPGRTYRFYSGSTVYPFGHGLSYSSWKYNLSSNQNERNLVSGISVNVLNTGSMNGSHSILIFHKGPNAEREGMPIKALIGFEEVFVSAGCTQLVKFNVEKWMTTQKSGTHTFMVGPTMDYTLQIDTLDGGLVS